MLITIQLLGIPGEPIAVTVDCENGVSETAYYRNMDMCECSVCST